MATSSPTADPYAELELEHTSSQEEITRAYRTLALVHHPDKNPGNAAEATARFQRIQAAYEILGDPQARSRYHDNVDQQEHRHDGRDGSHFAGAEQRRHNDDDDDAYDFDFADLFGFASSAYEEERQASYRQRHEAAWRRHEERLHAWRRQDQERREREKVEREQAVRKARLDAELAAKKARLDAKLAAKLAAEQAARDLQARRREGEKAAQERAWEAKGAVSDEQKKACCLHSEMCAKERQKKKLKCEECGAKRGMYTFQCPYCCTLMCQVCLGVFAERRRRAAVPKEEDGPGPEISG